MFDSVKFERSDEGINMYIDVDEYMGNVHVESITMFISTDVEEFEDNECWGDGDLAVNWSVEGIENTGGGDTGMLLLRGWEDEMGEIMRLFYSEEAFTDRLREILVAHGFSEEAADNVNGSEWGMQDEGLASYDAYEIADEVRKYFGISVAA